MIMVVLDPESLLGLEANGIQSAAVGLLCSPGAAALECPKILPQPS